MAFTRVAALLHAALSDVTATDHHTATVAADINHQDLAARGVADHHAATVAGDLALADLATRAHSDLTGVGIGDHHAALAEADQAALEAETVEATYVPPDLLKHSPGVAKVWVSWEQAGTHSILASYNMTSVTDGGAAGDTDHLWNVDFSSDAYAIVGAAQNNQVMAVNVGTQIGAGVTTITIDMAGNGADVECYLAAYGDQ